MSSTVRIMASCPLTFRSLATLAALTALIACAQNNAQRDAPSVTETTSPAIALIRPPEGEDPRSCWVRQTRETGETFEFQTPCPPVFTSTFIASVQRALAARGAFSGDITGQMDAPTRAAILRYQTEAQDRPSDVLSFETALTFGLVRVDLSET